jgi:hypothetical protein
MEPKPLFFDHWDEGAMSLTASFTLFTNRERNQQEVTQNVTVLRRQTVPACTSRMTLDLEREALIPDLWG